MGKKNDDLLQIRFWLKLQSSSKTAVQKFPVQSALIKSKYEKRECGRFAKRFQSVFQTLLPKSSPIDCQGNIRQRRTTRIDIISSIIGCCSCFMKKKRLPVHLVIWQEWHFSSFVLGIALFSTWIPCLMTRAHVNYRWHVFRVSQLCYTNMHAQQSENIKPNTSHIW